MKKLIFLAGCVLLALSCVDKAETGGSGPAVTNLEHFLTSEEFDVPVKEGCVTQVIFDGDVIAEAVSPMTIMIPKQTSTKSAGAELVYVPMDEYPNDIELLENKAKLYQVVCFEDSKQADYDYNDLVIHVFYKLRGNRFGFAVHPVALGSSKPIKLGCAVYKGNTLIYKGLLTPEGIDCRTQYFESQEGFINTVGTTINQQNGGWNSYLGSTIRNWKTASYDGAKGAFRVEWYIEVDNGVELYALSTNYLNQSFDKDKMPYGLVITDTGSKYTEYGYEAGHDWFNYPQESSNIKDVYPEIWEWLTTNKSFNFADIYSRNSIPAKAYPASDLGLFSAPSEPDVCHPKYCQN